MAADIYTIGGGEIVYEVLKAVSLCLNGGGGVLRGLITIGCVSASVFVYYMFLAGNVEYIVKKWALPVTIMLSFMFVPTMTVWVHDEVSQFHKKLDHVPLGLGQFASHITTIGKAITSIVEQPFSLPDDLKYHKAGIVFGSDILEKAKEFKIVNQNFRENLKNFVGQCVKYDIMLNNKYTFDDLRDSADLWGLITSSPSRSRGIFWIPIEGGKAQYVTCAGAVEKFNQEWKNELNRVAFSLSKKMFSGRAIGHSSLQNKKFVMTPTLANVLKREFMANLQSTYSYLGDLASSAEEVLKQNIMINAMGDASSENSRASGNTISYAEMKSIVQQNYTFDTIGRLAAKVLPIMKAVIEALVYACFIFMIPLCMIPSGYKFLMNWGATLIWINFWPPVYAILNFIMNIAARASTISEVGTNNGITISNIAGVAAANSEIKVLAGYLAISVPFICIALVKGVGNFVHLAGQMTGATTSAAGSAAGELISGNMSYGNINLGNSQVENISQLQRNRNSLIGSGGHKLDTGGVMITQDAGGFSVMTRMQDTGPRSIMGNYAEIQAKHEVLKGMKSEVSSGMTRLSNAESVAKSITGRIYEQVSNMKVADVAQRFDVSAHEAKNLSESFRFMDSHSKGKAYNRGTSARGSIGLGSVSVGGSVGADVQASKSKLHSSQEQITEEQAYNHHKSVTENAMRSLARSDRNDELSGLARERSQALQEVNSLSREQSKAESMLRQQEESYNNSVQSTISSSETLVGDFVELTKTHYDMSENQAKELLYDQNRRYDPKRQAITKMVASRIIAESGLSHGKEALKPDIDESNLQLSKSDMENEYSTKKQIAQTKFDETGKMINRQGEKNKTTEGFVKTKVLSTDSVLSKGKTDITEKGQQIELSVKKRSKDCSIESAGKELIKTITGDDENEK